MTAADDGSMQVWLSLPFLPPHGLRQLSLVAEQAGVTGVALSEHPCVPVGFTSPYPYGGGKGKPVALPPDTLLPDPLITTAGLAAGTSTLRFMTAVLIAPLRHPVMLAKEVATVSALTDGRFDLGVGVGWLREEFEALGVPTFGRRGRVLDEMLSVLPRLWTGEPVSHRGVHFSFEPVAVNPTPAGRVPIFVGGTSRAALRRCAAFGDGWVGANHSVDEMAEIVAGLVAARAEAGTADRPFEIRTGLRGTVTRERMAALRELGVHSFLLAPWQVGERRESIHDLPIEVIAAALPQLVDMIKTA
ncbi:TIGR03619 family F420-dependent LLM class oxidoreductase [Mycolicibacterium sp.]|uniref:TIGR03619 family F420-dependent LLM class oxidoreductase n=1 Tax=Mycolicibacterium sp. TaxID=2320850 RepID=UPI003D0AF2A6